MDDVRDLDPSIVVSNGGHCLSIDPEKLEIMRRLFVILDGQDPEAQQTLNNFLKFNNNIERSNFPTTKVVLCISQLSGYGNLLFGDDNNPFSMIADTLAITFMARQGDKSKQFVELMKQTPSLSDLQQIEPQQQGLMDRLLGRGPTTE